MDNWEIFSEVLITYNNSVHSAAKLTPYELFFGRPHIFNETIKFNGEHEYLRNLNEYQQIIYPKIKEKLQVAAKNRIEKFNRDRVQPKTLQVNDIIYRKESRRNKITPRFSKNKVQNDKKITFISDKNQKIHKSKIKGRKKKTN